MIYHDLYSCNSLIHIRYVITVTIGEIIFTSANHIPSIVLVVMFECYKVLRELSGP